MLAHDQLPVPAFIASAYANAVRMMSSGKSRGEVLTHLATAAERANVVVTPDFLADEKWAELKHLPLALGFVGAWSMPIMSRDSEVLGTFGTYFRERREPTP